jgi:Ankyrin repeats (many copies)
MGKRNWWKCIFQGISTNAKGRPEIEPASSAASRAILERSKVPSMTLPLPSVSVVSAALLLFSVGCSHSLENGNIDSMTTSNAGHTQGLQENASVSILVEAIGQGDLEAVRRLLEAGTDPNESIGSRGVLASAITNFKDQKLACNLEMLRVLLKHGANPNKIDPLFKSLPLHEALGMGDMACISLLREYGANPDVGQGDQQSSMTYATKGAVLTGNLKLLELPIAWGVDPNIRGGGRGWTALFEAIFAKNLTVVKALIALGVNPCVRDENGTAPIDYARSVRGSAEMIDVLAKSMDCNSGQSA